MCVDPIRLKRPTPLANFQDVPCGKCYQCLDTKFKHWLVRLVEELKNSRSAYFITFTYDDDHNDGSVHKAHLQKFFKRLRKFEIDNFKYYARAEYGSKTKRPHYHILFFNLSQDQITVYKNITRTWDFGSFFIGSVTEGSISYTLKYIQKGQIIPPGCNPVFNLISKGLGIDFTKKSISNLEQPFYQHYEMKYSLPRYYKEKLFSKEEQAKISIRARSFSEKLQHQNKDPIHLQGVKRYNKANRKAYDSDKL